VPREETLDRAEAEHHALRGQIAANLLDGGVPIGAERGQHGGAVGFDAPRATVAAQRFRPRVALLALARSPTADACGAHAEPLGRLPRRPREPPQEPEPEDQSTEPLTCLQASDPADGLNQKSPDSGIAKDSFSSDFALV
jgi:hypothetical protein